MPQPDVVIHSLLDAMLSQDLVMVTVDFTNGIGEVTRPKGWFGTITEIRRAAQDINAYGHLDPVIGVRDPGDRATLYLLSPEQVERV